VGRFWIKKAMGAPIIKKRFTRGGRGGRSQKKKPEEEREGRQDQDAAARGKDTNRRRTEDKRKVAAM